MAATSFSLKGSNVKFVIGQVQGSYEGKLSARAAADARDEASPEHRQGRFESGFPSRAGGSMGGRESLGVHLLDGREHASALRKNHLADRRRFDRVAPV